MLAGATELARKNRRKPIAIGNYDRPDIGPDTVDNPYDVGPAKIVVLRSYRDDQLALMFSRNQLVGKSEKPELERARYEAGRKYQALWRRAEISPLQAMDPMKEPVDGGGPFKDGVSDQKLAAYDELKRLSGILGRLNVRLLYAVLIEDMSLKEYTRRWDWGSSNAYKAVTWQFRQALELLATEVGLVQTRR